MRIGISLMYWPWFAPPEQLALAVQADRLGLHSAWVAEGYGQEAAAMLGLLAGRTDRILLGAGILQIPARQPTTTTAAMAASAVDRVSGGRMLLGLGLSGPQVSEGWYGVPFTAPLRRTREYVEIVRLALSGQRVACEGVEWAPPARGGLGLGKPLKLIAAPEHGAVPVYLGVGGEKIVQRGKNFYVDLAERYGHGRSARACQDAYLAGDKRAAAAALSDELAAHDRSPADR